MKRRGNKYPVSTFPFLAVLLCAMGSLILLLLVMDRRAKIVARAKALEAVSQVAEQEEAALEEERQRLAEYERQRHALQALLAEQVQQARAEMNEILKQSQRTAQTVQSLEERSRSLADQLRTERDLVAQAQRDLQQRHLQATKKTEQSKALQAELQQLTAQLLDLEQTLANLKAAKRREQHTYSVIPYRGKYGEARRPIYVECRERGIVLHPDQVDLQGVRFSDESVRAEVERRIARRKTIAAKEEKVYLFLLVRPLGVETYYRVLKALDGLPLDYGYEFIDPDWVLDFPVDEAAPTPGGEHSGGGIAKAGPAFSGGSQKGRDATNDPPRGTQPGAQSGPGLSGDAQKRHDGTTGSTAGAISGPPFSGGSQNRRDGTPSGSLPPTKGAQGGNQAEPGEKPSPSPAKPGPAGSVARHAGDTNDNADQTAADRLKTGGDEKPGRPPAAKPGTLIGNREWTIIIECTAEAYILSPGRQKIATSVMPSRAKPDNPLLQAVQQLIERKQKTVRPGEPPYRPRLRFLVHPEGMRAYRLAYPGLETLRIPMECEHLEKEVP